MQRSVLGRLTGLALATSLFGQAGLAQEQDYTLATASPGGTYHPVGVALSSMIKIDLLPRLGVDLNAVNTAGSAENARLLRQNQAQFAIMSALVAYNARTGTGPFEDDGPDHDLRIISNLWLSTDHFVVAKDLAKSGTIFDFLALKGETVSLGKKNSGTLVKNQALLSNLGAGIDDYQLASLGYGESAKAFIGGEIAGMNLSGGVPVPAMTETLEALGEDAVILEFNDDQLRAADGGLGLWAQDTIPAGTYPNQPRDILTVGTPNFLVARTDVDEDTVYEMTKSIFENLDTLQQMHPATRQITLEKALASLPVPLHPGAARYFEEKGLRVPVLTAEAGDAFLQRYRTSNEAISQVNKNSVGLITGPAGETSARAASEFTITLSSDDLRVVAMTSNGSGQNIRDLLYLKGVDAAIVQTDVLRYAAEEHAYPGVEQQIAYITHLYDEEVHILARADITSVGDLGGQSVSVGPSGSGSELTASILFDHLQIAVDRKYLDPYTALEKLRSGEIAAAIFVSGKPVTVLDGVEFIDGLHLLPVLSPPRYGDTYRKASFSPYDYPALVEPGKEVPTFAVRTALVAYNWKPDQVRYDSVARLVETLFDNLPRLQTSGHHAKLREINLRASVDGFPRFAPAERWLEAHADPGTASPSASVDDAVTIPAPLGGPLQQENQIKTNKMTPTF